MKKKYICMSLGVSIFLLSSFILHPSSLFSQMVVSKGWENQDSIRFEVFDAGFDGGDNTGAPPMESADRTKRIMDSLGVNMIFSYAPIPANFPPFGTKRKGFDAYPWDYTTGSVGLQQIGENLKQRIYYPSPERIDLGDDAGYRWRYIDTVRYSWKNNTYDANDISPYAEFDKDPTFVTQKYFSRMNHSSGDSMKIGTEGRMILGYNDQRRGDQMLVSHHSYPFLPNKVAQAFSARLEFNVERDSIFSSDTTASAANLPLLRVQILYKKGQNPDSSLDHGWPVLPFVPFKRTPTATDSGWYAIIDTMITGSIYDSLRDSWRVRDTLADGTLSHNWNFKQLNMMLKNLPSYMKIDTAHSDNEVNGFPEYGTGTVLPRIKNIIANPDTYVDTTSDWGQYINYNLLPTPESPTSVPLIEIRILSTYRTKIRIRSLSWQDTLCDKFLYRARFSGGGKDSTHSLNPDGTYGGLDDTVHYWCKRFGDLAAASGCTIRELMFNDVNPYLNALSMPSLGYFDYMLSKEGLHTQMRPQEHGQKTFAMRRERMSYDGIPPSIVQNQYGHSYPQRGGAWYEGNNNINDVFPGDYIPSGSLAHDSAWNSQPLDTMQGLLIARPGNTADFYKAYRTYTEIADLQFVSDAFRGTAYAALKHKKKTAWQASPPLWGQINTGAIKDSAYHWRFPLEILYDIGGGIRRKFSFANSSYSAFRPMTPEENNCFFYLALANGASGFHVGQMFDVQNGAGGGSVTLFSCKLVTNPSDSATLDYSYNFGHRRTDLGGSLAANNWTTQYNNIADSVLPNYYLGYANQFRATQRAISRINQVYDTLRGNQFPLKRFTWLDAYSTQKAIQIDTTTHPVNTDSLTKSKAFLKCFCTTSVKLWTKGSHGEYLDSLDGSGRLVPDSARRTYVEVGLFRDSNSTVNAYAALVVNTRLYPDHKTGADSVYYCQGLDSLSRPHSLFGDIAVRKVWFKIDTNQFVPTFRTQYYVLRDLWHPDSVWLVKNDSNFAIYIKPGDAKFLYIEKGISIQVAKTATVSSSGDFLFNNGRRVAERMKGSRTVEVYTRSGKLYVSNASIGTTIPGYNEHSAGDNIATGNEVCIDTSTQCYRPSICVGRDDKSVAIAYGKSPDQIWVAYQAHPDSGWHTRQNIQYSCIDSSSDSSWVTPM